MFRFSRFATVLGLSVVLASCRMAASTGHPNEITNIHFEKVTQTTADVVWNTVHPGTSQVVIARTREYEPERWAPEKADPALVTAHRVTVDRLFPNNEYYIYVVSVDGRGNMSTAPGPQTVDGKNPFLAMRTAPTNTSGPTDFEIYTLGPTEVFAGYDMYFLVPLALVSGPVSHLYVHNTRGYNNGSDGVVKYLGAGRGNPESITVHFSCTWSNSSGSDAEEQTLDRGRNMGFCYNGNNNQNDLSFRLRTAPNTIPGQYSVSFTLESDGQQKTGTYGFTVLPPPGPPPTPQLTSKPIPGLATWEKEMVALGNKWCSYRDQQNAEGNFVDNWGWTGDAWFYDGGRVFENIDTYTAAAGHPNHSWWQHCALNLLDPYANYVVANNGVIASYSMFSYGMAMNYSRTRSPLMRKAVHSLATLGPHRVACGFIDPDGIRENAYRSNSWLANEMLGAPRWPLLQRNIDKLMGMLNMVANGQPEMAHPFMVGLAMETLIHWYDLNLAEGHPDYRVIPVIKEALDALWRDSWVPKMHMFDYDRYNLPSNSSSAHTALNNMVSFAYAWYWLQTGDTVERDRGDLLFQHAFDDPDALTWSGKQFSQLYEFSFDFVRYRQGLTTSSVIPENNPYTGPYADTVPPISEKVNCDPNFFPGCKPGSIGSTTATIFWKTYKPATTQLIYGMTTGYGQSSALDSTMVLSHTVQLTGLRPGTTYHFRTRSVDVQGKIGSMHDLTFTTSPERGSKNP